MDDPATFTKLTPQERVSLDHNLQELYEKFQNVYSIIKTLEYLVSSSTDFQQEWAYRRALIEASDYDTECRKLIH